jgi:hypothetical protein
LVEDRIEEHVRNDWGDYSPNGLPGSFGAKTYVISSSLLDTSLRSLSSDMAEVVGIVAIIGGKTEGFA